MISYDDTTHLERQLSSLFRAEAQDAHLPLGTWQEIAPKMGEPDRQSLSGLIRDALRIPLAEKMWRNPMRVRYVAPAATLLLAAIAAILFVLLSNPDADENDPVPAGSPTPELGSPTPVPTFTPLPATPTTVPTATSTTVPTLVPTATVVPSATSTPIATPTASPTPQPAATATPVPGLDDVEWPESGMIERPFPEELKPGSEPMGRTEVEAMWTEFLADTAVTHFVGIGTPLDMRMCASGRGRADSSDTRQRFVYDWSIRQSPAGRWYEALIRFANPTGEFVGTANDVVQINLTSSDQGLLHVGLTGEESIIKVYEYPECPLT